MQSSQRDSRRRPRRTRKNALAKRLFASERPLRPESLPDLPYFYSNHSRFPSCVPRLAAGPLLSELFLSDHDARSPGADAVDGTGERLSAPRNVNQPVRAFCTAPDFPLPARMCVSENRRAGKGRPLVGMTEYVCEGILDGSCIRTGPGASDGSKYPVGSSLFPSCGPKNQIRRKSE